MAVTGLVEDEGGPSAGWLATLKNWWSQNGGCARRCLLELPGSRLHLLGPPLYLLCRPVLCSPNVRPDTPLLRSPPSLPSAGWQHDKIDDEDDDPDADGDGPDAGVADGIDDSLLVQVTEEAEAAEAAIAEEDLQVERLLEIREEVVACLNRIAAAYSGRQGRRCSADTLLSRALPALDVYISLGKIPDSCG